VTTDEYSGDDSRVSSRFLESADSEHVYSEWKPKQDNAGLQSGKDFVKDTIKRQLFDKGHIR
jgi:hypothetical protein